LTATQGQIDIAEANLRAAIRKPRGLWIGDTFLTQDVEEVMEKAE